MKRLSYLAAMTAAAATLYTATPAQACGGCFVPATESTVVTGHRMALSISATQAVLWDQIQYSGDPTEFSWVLPVKDGTRVETASSAFFEALEAGTQTTVLSPPEGCGSPGGGIGCGASDFASENDGTNGSGGGGVQVKHRGAVGPYLTVTLASDDPMALRDWLVDNGFDVPKNIEPIIDQYVGEGFDFLALKLQPNKGVQDMTPVRVVSPSSMYSLPLRMVAAGAGANVDLVLYVFGEGRYEAANFENATITGKDIIWDFRTDESNYAKLRADRLGQNDGRTWLTSYAAHGGVMSSDFRSNLLDSNNQSHQSIIDLYFAQGAINDEKGAMDCGDFTQLAESNQRVVKNCDDEGHCTEPGAGKISAQQFICNGYDDFAVALTGLHPADVQVTRLEASLPVAALSQDLLLRAAREQVAVSNQINAQQSKDACWDQPSYVAPIKPGTPPSMPPRDLMALTLAGAAALVVARRRRRIALEASV